MESTQIDDRRLTSEKPQSNFTDSSDPPAYSGYLNTGLTGNDDEQLLARLGYKQVSCTLN
jgi:hypothetical protein